MKKLIILFLSVFWVCALQAQCDDFGPRGPVPYPAAGVMDGAYMPSHIPTKKVIPYPYIREADVMWSRKIWRVIDLREKFNQPLYYPMDDIQEGMWQRNTNNWSLWTILRQHILNGDLTLYSPFNPNWEDWKDGDQFKYPVTSNIPGGNFCNDDDFRERLFMYLGKEEIDPFAPPLKSMIPPYTDDSVRYNPITKSDEYVYPPGDTIWFTSKDIVQYKIKEHTFFDRQRSVMETRILGIAPVIYSRDKNGAINGFRDLFWVYFPECRFILQNYFVENRRNSSQRMSFNDLFMKRKFMSYIVKESNLSGREIESYKAGIDALLESEKIKEEMFNFEHDLWTY